MESSTVRMFQFILVMPAAVLAVCALAGCGGRDDAAQRRPAYQRPPGYEPAAFADIRLPLGWNPLPGHDQVALSLGGGGIRVFEVALAPPPGKESMEPAQVARLASTMLPETGWVRVPEGKAEPQPTDTRQRFTKGDEVLLVEAGFEDGLLQLRYALRRADEQDAQ